VCVLLRGERDEGGEGSDNDMLEYEIERVLGGKEKREKRESLAFFRKKNSQTVF